MLEENLASSKVWNKQVSIDSKQRYFLSSNSGKGKSTFLNFLFGLRNDFKGTLSFDNELQLKFHLPSGLKLEVKK